MSESLSALEGFAALMRQRVSALAVVSEGQDGSRSLVSALSASHLRYVATADDLQALVRCAVASSFLDSADVSRKSSCAAQRSGVERTSSSRRQSTPLLVSDRMGCCCGFVYSRLCRRCQFLSSSRGPGALA